MGMSRAQNSRITWRQMPHGDMAELTFLVWERKRGEDELLVGLGGCRRGTCVTTASPMNSRMPSL